MLGLKLFHVSKKGVPGHNSNRQKICLALSGFEPWAPQLIQPVLYTQNVNGLTDYGVMLSGKNSEWHTFWDGDNMRNSGMKEGFFRHWHHIVFKLGKIFKGPIYKVVLSFVIISDVYKSIQIETTFPKYCLTQWISKLPRSFEIHWVRQYLVNFTGLAGIVHAIVYKTESFFSSFRHGTLS